MRAPETVIAYVGVAKSPRFQVLVHLGLFCFAICDTGGHFTLSRAQPRWYWSSNIVWTYIYAYVHLY